ncbi:MAG: rhodanese-like domain-containing protein [Spirochaetales bacterium]|nr:rhodanese-like domain-containing protein [Spirochaetales bacterium]
MVKTITPESAYKLVLENEGKDDFHILDIRTPAEYDDGHLEDAILLDYYSAAFEEELDKLDKNATWLVYCRTGNRSGKAMSIFERLGFHRVYNMGEGIVGWKRLEYPLVSD